MRARRVIVALSLLATLAAASTRAKESARAGQAVAGAQSAVDGGAESIQPAILQEWLTYLASDALEGREVYSEGLGLAASYIADRLHDWDVKPGGDNGTYFQTIKVLGIKTTSRSSVTVEVNGVSRTFKDGEGISLPRNMGVRQTVTADRLQFVGYGLQVPSAGIDDYANVDPKGKIVIWLGASGPKGLGQGTFRLLIARSRVATEKGAVAVIGPPLAGRGGQGWGQSPGQEQAAQRDAGRPSAGRGATQADFITAQRYDRSVPPVVTAEDAFFEFLFSGSDAKYSELKDLAARQAPLPRVTFKNVRISINVDPDYEVVSTRLSRNVVGIVEGTDPALKDTYVAFGAHYDHIGYQETSASGRGGANPGGCVGQTRPTPRPGDIINNGADDDGSGTVALMAVARAFARGARPKRSLLFVWHTAEESGLLGSRYNADFPIVPNDSIVAQLNADMVGRNRCDQPSEADTVYLVGSDRISTELHNLSEDANSSMAAPLKLDYEMNDPADPQSIYTRSDHYSYAAKGIPIIFYTTGLHRDYHYLTDEVDKIEFPKMARIAKLIYATGERVANLDHAPERDNKGPRVGKGSRGKILRGP